MPDTRCRLLRCFGFVGLLFLIGFCAYVFAQNKNAKKEASLKGHSYFGVKVNAVVINAAVTDKAGNPVTDLTARDFKLYDDGVPQSIQTFAMESIDPLELEKAQVPAVSSQSNRKSPKRETPQKNTERPPRLISIVIDDLTMEFATGANRRPGSIPDFSRIVDAVKKFVTRDLSPADQVAILSGSRNVQFPFTDDKTRLLEELDAVPGKVNTNSVLQDAGIDVSDYEAWMTDTNIPTASTAGGRSAVGEMRGLLALRQIAELQSRIRNLLYTIRLHLRVLSHFEGPKMVVLFSYGFAIPEIGRLAGAAGAAEAAEVAELQELINMALHSGIILNAVSIRGITAENIISTPEFPAGPMFIEAGNLAQQQECNENMNNLRPAHDRQQLQSRMTRTG